ncbi:deoxyguanosinetriphosphate triphosphohydrolase [Agathobaculum sp.]|uniref:deoxyguanosinetriphosphate triphosphohydrolase n=1 Tax=Agathobaculum sp. TaxID=2048138 RepID=UPI002A80B7D8|nr:deoxyguanosinetriphosphate triphosphohydrolase [Agathobaculum sp.]MDY3617840.1 deoxyguanosinetriphosphate triphosphohydrolase [Agathobaculum sp.]
MTVRERQQEREAQTLSDWATPSTASRGRQRPMEECPYRTCFQRDRDRIIHSKAFRRLSNKTQVFISPEGDHYRARLTHTLEVAQIARTIARALSLNEDLTEAIALGHDLGHTPFGHAGERALDEVCPLGFRHNEQSLRMVDRIEDLNLTYEVRDGIVCHTGSKKADTPEGRIIHYADRIAYINHDIDDAVRGGLIRAEDIPCHLLDRLGNTHGKRIDTMVTAVITYGFEHREIGMDKQVLDDMLELRTFMFHNVYQGTDAQSEEQRAKNMLRSLYEYFVAHPGELPDDYRRLSEAGDPLERVVCDYIACMTDRYSISTYKRLFIPKSWNKIET